MTNVMVTGGSGFVCTPIVRMLAERGDKVTIYDSTPPLGLRAAMLKGVMNRVKYARGDILDLPRMLNVIKTHDVEKIIHGAAYVDPGWAPLEPMVCCRINIEGTINVFEAARTVDINRVVYISSAAVYGVKKYEPIDEDHPKNPSDPYASSKLMGEYLAMMYLQFHKMDPVIVRCTSIYGPTGHRRILINTIIENAVDGKPTRLPSGRDFKRALIYVKDVATGVLRALDVETTRLKHRVFNIAGTRPVDASEPSRIVQELILGAVIEIGPGISLGYPLGSEDIDQLWRVSFSIDRARKELGWEPKYDLRSGIQDYIDWYKELRKCAEA